MYNGIGLQTPRGSGTSGYVQKNLSYVKQFQQKPRDDFLKELQALKDNVLAPPKKANPEIILHQQKRDIQLHLMKLRLELEARGESADAVESKVKKAEDILHAELASGKLVLKSTLDAHQKALEKEKEYERLRKAFEVDPNYKPGSAFDFDTQEKNRLKKLAEMEQKKLEDLEKLREQKKMEKKAEKQKLKDQESKKLEESTKPKQIENDSKRFVQPEAKNARKNDRDNEKNRKKSRSRSNEKKASHRRNHSKSSSTEKRHKRRSTEKPTTSDDKKNRSETKRSREKDTEKRKRKSSSSSSRSRSSSDSRSSSSSSN